MMEFEAEFENWEQLERNLKEQMKDVLFMRMMKMEEIATRYAPVDYGFLSLSISLTPQIEGSEEYTLTTNASYGVYIEFGTSNLIEKYGEFDPENPITSWGAKEKRGGGGEQRMPFMRPAYIEVREEWVQYYWVNIVMR